MPCFDPVLMTSPGRPRSIIEGTKICVPRMTRQIDCEYSLPVVCRPEDGAAGLDAGVVHQDVCSAEAIADHPVQPAQGFDPADIRLHGEHVICSVRRKHGELLGRRIQPVCIQVRDAHAKTELCEPLGGVEADPGSATCYHSHRSWSEGRKGHEQSFAKAVGVASHPFSYQSTSRPA